MKKAFTVVAVACALLVLPACSMNSTSSGSAPGGQASPGGAAAGGATSLAPGRTPKRGGRVEVIGTLQRDDNGQWIVVGAAPAQAASGRIIAVIVNPTTLPGVKLTELEGSYVRVTGTAADGIATDKSGLGLIADAVAKLPTR